MLSFLGLVILSPLFLILCIAVLIDNPGPVFFKQKRVGKGKTYFSLYKFRSMKMSTPHDTPTHLLELFIDFALAKSRDVYQSISAYVLYYNKQRPCYSIGYDTPDHYYSRYMSGELEKKDTFSKRVLSETPKFVQKKKLAGTNNSMPVIFLASKSLLL